MGDDFLTVRVPEEIGLLSSATGDRIVGGSIGRVTRREARIYGLVVVDEAEQEPTPAPVQEPQGNEEPKDTEDEVARLQELVEAYGVKTTAKTVAGLRRALEEHDIDPDDAVEAPDSA